jgi:hypothetical protein
MIVSSYTELVPYDQELLPSDAQLVPSYQKFIPFHSEFVPCNRKFIPSHPKFVSSNNEFVPFQPEFVPSDPESVPSHKEFGPGIQNLRKETWFRKMSYKKIGKIYRNTGQYIQEKSVSDVFSTFHGLKHKFHLRNYVTDQYKSMPLK